mgnify:CR=1 FL=1
MQISDILSPAAVRTMSQITSKKRLFQEIAEQARAIYGVEAVQTLDALQERESLGPTGVGHGVALPHARLHGLDRVVGLFLRLEKPLDFDAVDRQPVDLIFALLAPKNAGVDHLKALALVSRSVSPDYHARIVAACQAAGFTPQPLHELQHWLSVVSLVAQGLAVALVPLLPESPRWQIRRQLPQAVDVYQQDTAAGHSGSVVVFGLGTNGVISNEQEVQQLIDLTGGKPTYFITIRMPYPWQENNNNTMLREAAKKNKNVGIIDWHGYSEGHSEYLNDDGIHPNMTGAYAYATMIRQAVCGQ